MIGPRTYGPCHGCGKTIPWTDQYCERCEAKMDWLDDHPGEELPDPADEDPPDWLLDNGPDWLPIDRW